MAHNRVKKISKYLKDKDIKDIAIAIMNIEQNNNQKLTKDLHSRYSIQYEHYFNNVDELTGILNYILQDKVYKIIPFESDTISD